jgi:hypothetical protein
LCTSLAALCVMVAVPAASQTFTATGSMTTARSGPTATLLLDGTVLVVGGFNGAYLASAEVYDPTTGTFAPTGSLATGRANHTATLLADGTVLVVGGFNGAYVGSAEIYDPTTGTFSPTASPGSRAGHTAGNCFAPSRSSSVSTTRPANA